MEKSKCFFCKNDATHFDIVVNHEKYIVADVCLPHLSMALTS